MLFGIFMMFVGFISAVALFKVISVGNKHKEVKDLEHTISTSHLKSPYQAEQLRVIGRSSMPTSTINSDKKAESELEMLFVEHHEQAPIEKESLEPTFAGVVIYEEDESTNPKPSPKKVNDEGTISEDNPVEQDPQEHELLLEAIFGRKKSTPQVDDEVIADRETIEKEELDMKKEDVLVEFVEAEIEDDVSLGFVDYLNEFVNTELDSFEHVQEDSYLTESDMQFIEEVTYFQPQAEKPGTVNMQQAPREASPVQNVILTLDELFDDNNVDAQFLKIAPFFADEYEHQLSQGISGLRSWIVQVVGVESEYIHVTDGTGRLWLDAENFQSKSLKCGDYLAIDAQDGEIKTLTVLNIEEYENAYALNMAKASVS